MVLEELIMLGWVNYAVCFLLIDASIFDQTRAWVSSKSSFIGAALECYFCTGAWTGIFVLTVYLMMIKVQPGSFSQVVMLLLFVLGLAAASHMISLVVWRLGYVPQNSGE